MNNTVMQSHQSSVWPKVTTQKSAGIIPNDVSVMAHSKYLIEMECFN